MDPRTLGDILRQARIAQFLTLREMAGRVGISSSQLGKFEKGHLRKPAIHALPAIALHYRIPYEQLTALNTWTTLEKRAITPAT